MVEVVDAISKPNSPSLLGILLEIGEAILWMLILLLLLLLLSRTVLIPVVVDADVDNDGSSKFL